MISGRAVIYFKPLKGLKAIKLYTVNSAAQAFTASRLLNTVIELKHKKSNRLKPLKAYTPPHMADTIKKETHK